MVRKRKVKERKRGEKRRLSKKHEKQLRIAVISMIVLIFLVFLIGFFIQRREKFEYAGLKFEKVKMGNLVLYATKFPVVNLSGNTVGYVPFYFREDPRELKSIGIEGNIVLKKKVALAIGDNFVRKCEDSILAVTSLSLFLKSTEIDPFGATTNTTEAGLLGRRYVTCGDANTILLNDYSVLDFRESSSSSINRINNDCYALNVANCEIIDVVEKFMLGVYAHSRRMKI